MSLVSQVSVLWVLRILVSGGKYVSGYSGTYTGDACMSNV